MANQTEDTTTTTTTNATTPDASKAGSGTPAPQGKTFAEDYVVALREEAKANRLAKKELEKKLRDVLGLKDDEDVDDSKIGAYKANRDQTITQALAKANERLIAAEIRGLDGYNAKLVEKLVDRSTLKVADDGTVTGLKEAVEALAKEFPEIRKATGAAGGGANPSSTASGGAKTPKQLYDEVYEALRKNPNDQTLRVRLMQAKEAMAPK